MRWRSRRRRRIAIGAFLTLVTACAETDIGPDELRVFAASAIAPAVESVAGAYEESAARVDVVISSGSSDRLAEQIADGAPADLFISADGGVMDGLGGLVLGSPVVVANTRLSVVVARGNPKGVAGLADLSRPELVVVLAAPEVPLGRYSQQVLEEAGVVAEPDSLELDAASVVGRVESGEADVGLAYAAGLASRDVELLEDRELTYHPVAFWGAVLIAAERPDLARQFLEFLGSDVGQLWLVTHGFERP